MKQFKISKSITDRNDPILNSYLKEIAKIPLITQEEEIKLSKEIKKGNIDARNKLVSANLRFVVSVAKQYQGMGIPLMDLINTGNLGLIESTELFDPDKGFKFISYAVWWIRQSITKSLFSESRTIRIPVSQTSYLSKIDKAIKDFEKLNERIPSVEELSNILQISEDKVQNILDGTISCTSIDVTVNNNEDASTLSDIIPNKNATKPDENLIKEDLNININILLSKFSTREQDILRMSYGLGGVQELPYEEIGKRFGLTGERVRQINNGLLERIKNEFSDLAKNIV